MSYLITLIKEVFTRNLNEICLRRGCSLSSPELRLGLGSGGHLIVIETRESRDVKTVDAHGFRVSGIWV